MKLSYFLFTFWKAKAHYEALMRQPRCLYMADIGPCNEKHLVYGYDYLTNDCIAFTYGGCGGNPNRFHSSAECLAACYIPDTDDDKDDNADDADTADNADDAEENDDADDAEDNDDINLDDGNCGDERCDAADNPDDDKKDEVSKNEVEEKNRYLKTEH